MDCSILTGRVHHSQITHLHSYAQLSRLFRVSADGDAFHITYSTLHPKSSYRLQMPINSSW